MRKLASIIIITLPCLLLFFKPVFADIYSPTTINIYFEKDGQPYNKPVEFEIICYGYSWFPGRPSIKLRIHPYKVYSLSASYTKYGDKTKKNIYLNYRDINYCEITGKTEGKEFEIRNLPKFPLENCKMVGRFFEEECDLRVNLTKENFSINIPHKMKRNLFERIDSIINLFNNLLIIVSENLPRK